LRFACSTNGVGTLGFACVDDPFWWLFDGVGLESSWCVYRAVACGFPSLLGRFFAGVQRLCGVCLQVFSASSSMIGCLSLRCESAVVLGCLFCGACSMFLGVCLYCWVAPCF
jgi:hypothetical protein